jgi:hypothetical protein
MADNLFLGLTALLAAHWLATTLPHANRSIYRLAALAVALPFGFRFEAYARSSTSGQVLAALAFGGLGTLVVGMLDIAVAGGVPASVSIHDLAASVAAIALSHLAGSFWASAQHRRAERGTMKAAAALDTAPALHLATAMPALGQVRSGKILSQVTAVKTIADAAAAVAATAAAVWAAFAHIVS